MNSSIEMNGNISLKYETAITQLGEIAEAYYWNGKASDAKLVLHHSLQLADTEEARPMRLLILLKLGKILAIEYVYTNADAELMFSTLQEARQLAKDANDRHSTADALSLLGMAHYYVDLNASASIDSSSDKYSEALSYQQQALVLREEINDTRGISESFFLIGTVHERRQQQEALDCYEKALQTAEQNGHFYEKTEPSRHFAFHALMRGDLEQALKFALEALRLREQAGFKPYLPLDHLMVSDIYLKQGDIDNALNHATEASRLAEEMGYKRAISSSSLSLGDIQAAMQNNDLAAASYKKALLLGQELKLPLVIKRASERLEQIVDQS